MCPQVHRGPAVYVYGGVLLAAVFSGLAGSAAAQTCGDNVRQGDEQCDGADDAACPGLCLESCECPLLRTFWVPAGEDPALFASGTTVVGMQPGERTCLEVWAQAFDAPFSTHAGQFAVQSRSANPGVRIDCSSVAIDQSHEQWAGFGVTVLATQHCEQDDGKVTAVYISHLTDPTIRVDIPEAPAAAYLLNACLIADADAAGAHTFSYMHLDVDTFWVGDGEQIPPAIFDRLTVHLTGYGDGICSGNEMPCNDPADCSGALQPGVQKAASG